MRLATSDDAAIYRHEWQTGDLLAWDNRARMTASEMHEAVLSLVESEETCRDLQIQCRLSLPMATGRSNEVADVLHFD